MKNMRTFALMKLSHVLESYNRVSPTWIALFLCGLNLFVMHFAVFLSCGIEVETDVTFFIDNIFGICFDVCSLFFVFYLLSWKRMKATLSLCFSVTWLWSFATVIYSRFFFHYLSLSAVRQGGILTDDLIVRCIASNLHSMDLYYLFAALLFVFLLRSKSVRNVSSVPRKVLAALFALFLAVIVSHASYCICNPQLRYANYFFHRLYVHHLATHRNLSQPNFAHFVRGEVRSVCAEIAMSSTGSMKLTSQQLAVIKETVSQHPTGMPDTMKALSDRNVIFILVESYMSFTSDMKVGGREVTPFLNSLKRDSLVYYNGNMLENVTIGESSDGQFIYMTGLLPLRSVITVSKARNVTLYGLPKLLRRESSMVIPTVTSMWSQDEMCRQYGFQHLYASNDYGTGSFNGLNDEQVFQLAMEKDKALRQHQPFFSVILTMSMHQPYKEQIDPTFPIHDPSMPDELACYLNVCHYTDRQLEKYFEHLKRQGLYDNSLIVIVADHPAHTELGGFDKAIPLFLVNVPDEVRSRMWKGECNQIDVYTTLLDLLGVESDWRGLGKSLLSPQYDSSIDAEKWDVSEWILRSDYFSESH